MSTVFCCHHYQHRNLEIFRYKNHRASEWYPWVVLFFPPVQLTVGCSTPQCSLPRNGQLKVGRRRQGPGMELHCLLRCLGWYSLQHCLLVSLSSSRILVWSNVDLRQQTIKKHAGQNFQFDTPPEKNHALLNL